MSLTYKIAAKIVKLLGVKKMFLKNKEEMLEYAKGEHAKVVFDLERAMKRAERKNYFLFDRDVMGYRLLSYQKNKTFSKEAVLYLFGGGMITQPNKLDFKLAERIMEKYNAPYEIIVGKGMCHCYPLARFFKEGREAQDEIIELLKY